MPALHSASQAPAGSASIAPSICGAVVGAIAQIAAGFIHELNNKLGPILLNAEMLGHPRSNVQGAAADIVRNAVEMQELLRDLEAILPRNLERDVPFEPTLLHLERVVRGALRRRRLRLDLPSLDDSCLMDADPCATMVAMLLVPFVFHGPPQGGHGTLKLRYASRVEGRSWRIEVDPADDPDPVVARTLQRICARSGWRLESGRGRMVVEMSRVEV